MKSAENLERIPIMFDALLRNKSVIILFPVHSGIHNRRERKKNWCGGWYPSAAINQSVGDARGKGIH